LPVSGWGTPIGAGRGVGGSGVAEGAGVDVGPGVLSGLTRLTVAVAPGPGWAPATDAGGRIAEVEDCSPTTGNSHPPTKSKTADAISAVLPKPNAQPRAIDRISASRSEGSEDWAATSSRTTPAPDC
jgi:hypothetical protein